jgi:UDPglucose 6-dehydrogenase
MKIGVVGLGYVGLSNAILLAQNNEVVAFDINRSKVDSINLKKNLFEDKEIQIFLSSNELNLRATNDYKEAFINADFIVIATPTNYNQIKDHFDTKSLEDVIKNILDVNKDAVIVIKSTVPIGYTEKINKQFDTNNIIFSPEFLREGRALFDNLYPSRIIVGEISDRAKVFADLLVKGAIKKEIPILLTNSNESEAIKLFSNAYLALRVSFFNELDSYAELKKMNSRQIINGVSLDPRIGNYYNNPSFGYGGYCLPKDTKQLLSNFHEIPNNIISAIVASNITRKNHIISMISSLKPKIVGIYKLTMKMNSDNYRDSSILDIISGLKAKGIDIVIFEPTISENNFNEIKIVNDFLQFTSISDVIVANRIYDELKNISNKVYSRDLFSMD